MEGCWGMKNSQIVIDSLPEDKLSQDHFRQINVPLPDVESGQVLIKTAAISIVAGARAGLQGSANYTRGPAVGKVMGGAGVGEVVSSNDEKFPEGVWVLGATGWQSYSALSTDSLTRIPSDRDPIDYLGPLGADGMAAYFGLLKVGRASRGDTVMVSAAAGSVGHFVGQMAKIAGCRVVGVCGNDLKCARLTDELGFDIAVNYKNHSFRKDLKCATPEGVDLYFDNTGGPILTSALFRMNVGGRIACCGVVSQYDTSSPNAGPKGIPGLLVNKRINMQGFLFFDYSNEYEPAREEISRWLNSGDLNSVNDEFRGLESAPEAFVNLLSGGNFGNRIVRLP